MTDPTRRQVDAAIESSMDLFKRADVGDTASIQPLRPQRVLVALDGSTQDYATALLARQLTERLGCQTGYVFVPNTNSTGGISSDIADDAAEQLKAISASPVTVDAGSNYGQILQAAESFETDLLIVPCPFGRDFLALGEDSTGTVIDVLTARATVPFIAVRRPDATGRDPSKHLRIILTGENRATQLAARWATGLVHPAGRLELLLLVEESFFENFRESLHSIQPDVKVTHEDLGNALARTHGKLHSALHRASSEFGFEYELWIRYEGDERPVTPEHPKTHPALMVVCLERHSHDSQGDVHDFVRRSPHPTLVVSVE